MKISISTIMKNQIIDCGLGQLASVCYGLGHYQVLSLDKCLETQLKYLHCLHPCSYCVIRHAQCYVLKVLQFVSYAVLLAFHWVQFASDLSSHYLQRYLRLSQDHF